MLYKIENRIETLAENGIMEKSNPASFSINDIDFSQWEFDYGRGWIGHHWLASGEIKAPNFLKAINIFRNKLADIVPKIAFISQCYCEFVSQSFLVTREDSDIGFIRHVKETAPVSLMFGDSEYKALTILQATATIPKEFYFYWNDAVNSTGYTSSLLLMFSAIETLVKDKKGKNWKKLEELLGSELKQELYGTKENSKTGLRHRITHGEYFSAIDQGKDYLDIVHKRVFGYFNNSLFKESLLSMDVVSPQRHLFGNKEGSASFIKSKGVSLLNLKEVLLDIEENGINNLQRYEYASDIGGQKSF